MLLLMLMSWLGGQYKISLEVLSEDAVGCVCVCVNGGLKAYYGLNHTEYRMPPHTHHHLLCYVSTGSTSSVEMG